MEPVGFPAGVLGGDERDAAPHRGCGRVQPSKDGALQQVRARGPRHAQLVHGVQRHPRPGDGSEYEAESTLPAHHFPELRKWHEYVVTKRDMRHYVGPGATYRIRHWAPELKPEVLMGDMVVPSRPAETGEDAPTVVLANPAVYRTEGEDLPEPLKGTHPYFFNDPEYRGCGRSRSGVRRARIRDASGRAYDGRVRDRSTAADREGNRGDAGRDGAGGMKITRVDAFAIGIGEAGEPEYLVNDDFRYSIYGTRHQTVIARVETDAGIVGYGEGQSPISPETTKSIVETALRPMLLGKDPLDSSALWYRMYSAMRERGHQTGFYPDALAAVDIALWDIKGRLRVSQCTSCWGSVLESACQCTTM